MGQVGATPMHFGYYLGTLLKTQQLTVSQLAKATQLESDFIDQLLTVVC